MNCVNWNPLQRMPPFIEKFSNVKLENKKIFAALIKERTGIIVNPSSMFDIQVKRIHEYKRQHLNVLISLPFTCD